MKYYADEPDTIEHLQANITDATAEIQPHILEKEHENLFVRMK